MARRLLFLILISAILVAVVQLSAGLREQWAEAEYPAKGERLDIDGMKVHAQVFGAGPNLVLIHGASGNTRDFTFSLTEQLKDRYRVIVFDRPGLGWTTQPDGYGRLLEPIGESPRLQASILRKAAAQLGVTNPLVLGHSFGGSVAMAWALEAPEDTAGVVMIGAVSHPWPGDLHWQYPVNASIPGGLIVVPLVSAFAPGGYVDNVVASIFAPQSAPDGYIEHVGTGLTLRRSALRANARQVNNLRPHVVEMAPEYPSLTMPIEIVHGDADTIVPMEIHSIPLSERVNSANLTVLEGVGHMPHHSDETAVIAAIDRAAERAGLR